MLKAHNIAMALIPVVTVYRRRICLPTFLWFLRIIDCSAAYTPTAGSFSLSLPALLVLKLLQKSRFCRGRQAWRIYSIDFLTNHGQIHVNTQKGACTGMVHKICFLMIHN